MSRARATVSVRVVTYWTTLMSLAADVGRARQLGDEAAIAAAVDRLKAYERAVRASDELVLGFRHDC